MWHHALALAILFLNVNAASLRQPIHKIVGGIAVNIEDFPHQVSIIYNNTHICGGSIISDKFILSAAHCYIYIGPTNNFQVRVGSTNSTAGGTLYTVKDIHAHTSYNETTYDYDFSIFELNDTIALDNVTSRVVRLTEINEYLPNGSNLTISGWGETRNPTESKEHLRAVSVPKMEQLECIASYLFSNIITDRMFCAGYRQGQKDACKADSGGPVLNDNNVQVGVVSWGLDCAQARYPGVYGRISSVRQWIREITNV
uniref:trypsin n=1 Tax=Lutzomyia longipalpis TaxID=7200 RepID=A0A7G3AZU5_LUTLO